MRAFGHLMIAMLGALTLAACSGKNATITDADISIGAENAPVTVVEYASVACPGCAAFNNEVWGDIKTRFIDTGQVKWVTKEMLTHDAAWAAAGFMAARCLGEDRYYDALDALYHAAAKIDASGDRKGGLREVMNGLGMSDAQFESCVSDEAALLKLNARIEKHVADDKITGTPTFFINGEEFTERPTLEAFSAAINAAKSKATAK